MTVFKGKNFKDKYDGFWFLNKKKSVIKKYLGLDPVSTTA
jgi:hypothetical protein